MSAFLKKALKAAVLCLLVGSILFGLIGCGNTHTIDYSGQKLFYQNAKQSYAEGETVVLYYSFFASDTDCSFTLDGEPLGCGYDEEKGYIISFTMPDHDVVLKCETTKVEAGDFSKTPAGTMLIEYYRSETGTDGGDGFDEIILYSYDEDNVQMSVCHSSDDGNVEVNYLIPYEAAERCFELIGQFGMKEWNSRSDLTSLDGVELVLKFRDGKSYLRASSEAMPEDGEKAFREIEAVLKLFIKDQYKTSD